MIVFLAFFGCTIALGSCGVINPVYQVYLQGPSAKTELIGADGSYLHAFSPGGHVETSYNIQYEDENPFDASVLHSGAIQLHGVSVENHSPLFADARGNLLNAHQVPALHTHDFYHQPHQVSRVIEDTHVVAQSPLILSQPVEKKTIVSSRLDQTHPSPILVPEPQYVETSHFVHSNPVVQEQHVVHSSPVVAQEEHVVHSSPVVAQEEHVVHSSPVVAQEEHVVHSSPVVETSVVEQPTPIISHPRAVLSEPVHVVAKAAPIITQTTSVVAPPQVPVIHAERVATIVEQPVKKVTQVVSAEVSELRPLVGTEKKYKLPAEHEAALSTKTFRVPAAFVAEGPDATYLAPGTGIRGQYVKGSKEDKHDDGHYKGEFYHGIGKVIKIDQNEI